MTPIVIVGAGPAGLMLAYQLAANGVPVRVLERHKDFEREFRGEFAQPSVLALLEALGILGELACAGRVVPIRAVRMHLGAHAFASNGSADGRSAGQAIHQPSFLALLHERCSRYPGYRLDLATPVTELVREGGRVAAVKARIDGKDERIDARLVVVCNGRASSLRKSVDLEAKQLEEPYSLLWLRFDLSRHPDLVPETLDGYVTRRAFYVLYPTYGKRAQLMWRRAKRYPLDWKSPHDTLRGELLADAPPAFRPIFEEGMTEAAERQVLRVLCDRLPRFWVPGALFLGDAAHTMSPIGGQGLTIAIRDAVVAANHLVRAHRAGGELGDDLLEQVEKERRPEVEKLQAFQVRAGRINDAPPLVQQLMARAIIPLATRAQGSSYLQELQHGVTTVRMEFPPRDASEFGGAVVAAR